MQPVYSMQFSNCLQDVKADMLDLRSAEFHFLCKLLKIVGEMVVDKSILILYVVDRPADKTVVWQCIFYTVCSLELTWRNSFHHKFLIVGSRPF
jgi:hypothetical protein